MLTVWRYVFVADFEALTCQVRRKFIRCRNAEIRTISAIKYTACYALAVLVCPWVPVKLHFHIKLVSSFSFSVEKNFEILLLSWLCKLFDKALVEALACGALAMCLQMRWLFLFCF